MLAKHRTFTEPVVSNEPLAAPICRRTGSPVHHRVVGIADDREARRKRSIVEVELFAASEQRARSEQLVEARDPVEERAACEHVRARTRPHLCSAQAAVHFEAGRHEAWNQARGRIVRSRRQGTEDQSDVRLRTQTLDAVTDPFCRHRAVVVRERQNASPRFTQANVERRRLAHCLTVDDMQARVRGQHSRRRALIDDDHFKRRIGRCQQTRDAQVQSVHAVPRGDQD